MGAISRTLFAVRRSKKSVDSRDETEIETDVDFALKYVAIVLLCGFAMPYVSDAGVYWSLTYLGPSLSNEWTGIVFASPLLAFVVGGIGKLRDGFFKAGLILLSGWVCVSLVMDSPSLLRGLRSLRPAPCQGDRTTEHLEFALFAVLACVAGAARAPRWFRMAIGVIAVLASASLMSRFSVGMIDIADVYSGFWKRTLGREVVSPAVMNLLPHLPDEAKESIVRGWGIQFLGKIVQLLGVLLMTLALALGVGIAARVALSRRSPPVCVTWLGGFVAGSVLCWIGEWFWVVPQSTSVIRDAAVVVSIAFDHGASLVSVALVPIGLASLTSAIVAWRQAAADRHRRRRARADERRMDGLLARIHRDGGLQQLSSGERAFLERSGESRRSG